jgi:hypothetical protein
MANQEDQSHDSIGSQAERLLEGLPHASTSRTASPHNKPARVTSQTNSQPQTQPVDRTSIWPVAGLALAGGSIITALTMTLALQISSNRQSNRVQVRISQPSSSLRPDKTLTPAAEEKRQFDTNSSIDTNHSAGQHVVDTPLERRRGRNEPQPQRELATKGINRDFQSPTSAGAGTWGSASAYKFGRLPDSTYPDSCAFSQTDSTGQTILSRSTLDYWACRDEGGNSSDGYSVAWADGKRTKYRFGPSGDGSVIGTNGTLYRVRWRNALRNGSKVIIIDHQDGAISWIPGQVD